MTKPWFGLHLPSYTFPDTPADELFERIVEQAQTAEQVGFSLVTVMDHLYQIRGVGTPTEPMLEGYSVLNALARETSRVSLSTLVAAVTYRNPALLVKMVSTLDVISGGRAIMGLGAGWNEEEATGFGYDFPVVKERMDRLDDALAIAKRMFTEERSSYDGRYSRVDEVINSPKPVQAGGPRILVGGGGEQRTLRIAAKYADMTHWFPLGMDVLQRKTDILAGYCAEIGRDPAEIERTMATPVLVDTGTPDVRAFIERMSPERRANVHVGSVQEAAEAIQPYLDAGFTGFTFNNTIYRTPEAIETVGELLHLIGG